MYTGEANNQKLSGGLTVWENDIGAARPGGGVFDDRRNEKVNRWGRLASSMDSLLGAAFGVDRSRSLLGRLRSNRPLFELPLAFQLRVMKTTCVAESASSIRAASPFGSIDPVAAVAATGRSSALSYQMLAIFEVSPLHVVPSTYTSALLNLSQLIRRLWQVAVI
jgi:hypothetical protein